MKPLVELGRATMPDGGVLQLKRRDNDFHLTLDQLELMSSRVHGSEVVLAELGCSHLRRGDRADVLIGGLGLGYTLRATLDVVGPGTRVTVAELVPEVIEWNRTHLAELQRGALTDRRTRLVAGDVFDVASRTTWNAILLDTDNGPDAFCVDSNARIYDTRGLARLRNQLEPGGVLAIWCAQAEPRFVKQLQRAGFEASMHEARGHSGKGFRHSVLLAKRREERPTKSKPQDRPRRRRR